MERDDEDLVPCLVNELPMTAALNGDPPAKAGHRPKEAAAVELAG